MAPVSIVWFWHLVLGLSKEPGPRGGHVGGVDPKRSPLSYLTPLCSHCVGQRAWRNLLFPGKHTLLGAAPGYPQPSCRAAVPGARSGEEGALTGTGSWAGGPQHLSKPCWTQAAFLVATLVSQGRILKQKAINALRGGQRDRALALV